MKVGECGFLDLETESAAQRFGNMLVAGSGYLYICVIVAQGSFRLTASKTRQKAQPKK